HAEPRRGKPARSACLLRRGGRPQRAEALGRYRLEGICSAFRTGLPGHTQDCAAERLRYLLRSRQRQRGTTRLTQFELGIHPGTYFSDTGCGCYTGFLLGPWLSPELLPGALPDSLGGERHRYTDGAAQRRALALLPELVVYAGKGDRFPHQLGSHLS